jgi:hypothetical protein
VLWVMIAHHGAPRGAEYVASSACVLGIFVTDGKNYLKAWYSRA